MLEWARKKVYVWLIKLYGFDKVLERYGVTDIEEYYEKLVKLLKCIRHEERQNV